MINEPFTLRPMQLSDISCAMQLSVAEGWNQTESDWNLFIEHPQNICLVAVAGKKVIGTTAAINYSNAVEWIGMVLVDKAYRGIGVSTLLMKSILKKSTSFKSIKLDATPAGQAVYSKLGFIDEYIITRIIGSSVKHLHDDGEIFPEPIQLKDIEEIIALDKDMFGAARRQLIEYLIKKYPGKSWMLKRNNQVTGFVLGRDGNKYNHIGPVMASSTADAKILISKALSELNNQATVVDVFNGKKDLLNWFYSIGFVSQRQFVRMYKDENPLPGIIEKQYLICGPEFG